MEFGADPNKKSGSSGFKSGFIGWYTFCFSRDTETNWCRSGQRGRSRNFEDRYALYCPYLEGKDGGSRCLIKKTDVIKKGLQTRTHQDGGKGSAEVKVTA